MFHEIKKIILRWLPAILWMTLIFWFSSQPDLPRPASDVLNFVMRKSAHFSVYAVLALTYLWALGDRRRWKTALLLAILYAISDEYHQSWTPRRYPTWTDVLIDTAGAATGLALSPWLWRRATARTTRSSAVDHGQANAETRA